MTISLRKLSEHIGISPAAVSSCLHGTSVSSNTSPERRHAILAAARELRYQPNNTIALLTRRLGQELDLMQLQFQNAVHDVGVQRNISVADGSQANGELSPLIENWRIGGAILLNHLCDTSIEALNERGIPYVLVNPDRDLPENCLIVDETHGMQQALGKLQADGCRSIAVILPKIDHPSYSKRRQAFEHFASSHGDTKTLFINSKTYAEGMTAFRPLLQGVDTTTPVGLITISDWAMAYKAVAIELGADDSLQLISVKSTSSAWLPPFDTLSIPMNEMAESAFEIISQCWAGAPLCTPSQTFVPNFHQV